MRLRASIGMISSASCATTTAANVASAQSAARANACGRGASRTTNVSMRMWRSSFMPSAAPMKTLQMKA